MSQAAARPLNTRGSLADYQDFDDARPLSGQEAQNAWLIFGVLMAAMTSAYFNMLEFTSTFWAKDMYSHGWIVPLLAGYLFWLRSRSVVTLSNREWLIGGGIVAAFGALIWLNIANDGVLSKSVPLFESVFPHLAIWTATALFIYCLRSAPLYETTPLERWIGVGIVAVSLAARVWTAFYDFNLHERLTFIAALLGVCLIVGGLSMLRWAWPPILFLMFMFPLPSVLEGTLLMRLQMIASILSTWTLQLLGVSAARMGNTISIDSLAEPLEVAEACSGLRMLTIFGAFTVAMAMTIDRPWWDKLAIFVLGWVPIALASNVIRIVVTALLFMAFGQREEWLNKIIHDWAGFAMMPIGLGLLWIELAVLSRLTIPTDVEDYGGFATA